MKHKKTLIIMVMFFVCTALIFADFVISFGPAYTNYLVKPKNAEGKVTGDAVKDAITGQLNSAKTEKNNAAGFAVDLHGDYLYAMIQTAFPSKTHNSILKDGAASLKKGAFILDTQIGVGYTFFKKSKFNLFLGGGVGFNIVSSDQTINIPIIGNINYKKLDAMVGAGANLLASFYFVKHIGIYAGIADTVYFSPLTTKKTFTVAGRSIDLDEKSGGSKFSNSFANSLNLKIGVSFKF